MKRRSDDAFSPVFTMAYSKLSESKCVPKFDSAKIAAGYTRLSEERLLELAEDGICPCVRVDGGPPMFFRDDICSWVKNNLVAVQPGMTIDRPVVLLKAGPPVAYGDLPDPLKLMSGLIEEFDVGRKPCVYFLVKDREIVYVGQSVNLGARLGAHASDKSFDKCLFMIFPREHLSQVETAFISLLKPKLNGVSLNSMNEKECRDTILEFCSIDIAVSAATESQ